MAILMFEINEKKIIETSIVCISLNENKVWAKFPNIFCNNQVTINLKKITLRIGSDRSTFHSG